MPVVTDNGLIAFNADNLRTDGWGANPASYQSNVRTVEWMARHYEEVAAAVS